MATANELGHRKAIRIGATEIRPATCEVIGPGGRESIEPRVMQVLVVLAEAAGETVTRDDLTMRCWGGRVVGDDSINRVIQKIRRIAAGAGAGGFTLTTIHKIGYRLCETRDGDSPLRPPDPSRLRRYAPMFLIALVAAVLTAGLGIGWADRGGMAPVSLAVLPFRSLSSGDGYFAEGIAEEIRGQLAREPQFRVTGRVSSSQFTSATDYGEIRRKLDVAYVLDGDVRLARDTLRVNVALIRTSDGTELWSESYDGRQDDIFAIQQRIGVASADALKRKLVGDSSLSGPLVTSGEAYTLYLTARGLMRTRQTAKIEAAVELLRRAVAIDPGYAPAWSSLGAASWMAATDQDSASREQREAIGYVRHALALAPNLADAHGAMGLILGFETPEAVAHTMRAAQLDPNNGEIQYWLGHALKNSGRFEAALAAYRRSAAIDPLWDRSHWLASELAWEMGDRQGALENLRQVDAIGDPVVAHEFRGHLAIVTGDLSGAVEEFSAARDAAGAGTRPRLEYRLDRAFRELGLLDEARRSFGSDDGFMALWRGKPPSLADIRARNADPALNIMYGPYNLLAVRLLLNSGRADGLARLYDGDAGLLRLSSKRPRSLVAHLVKNGPTVALVLRGAGRDAEADRLLAEADRAIAAVLRRGRAPTSFHAASAEVFALRGDPNRALAALERAIDGGWTYTGDWTLPDIGDEPAFRSLRGNPRFERIRTRLKDHVANERRELALVRS